MAVEDSVRCVLVDDEIEGLDILEALLMQINGVEVLSKISDSERVIDELIAHKPDIVFLDINMPKKSGLELLKEINNIDLDISVIFVTAFDQYIFEALKNSAFDYLVKPVDRDELRETIERFIVNRDEVPNLSEVINSIESISKIKIPILYGALFFNPEDLVFFKADGAYTSIHLSDGEVETTSLNIGKLEEKLKGKTFFRISRQVLINLKYLYKLDKSDRQCVVKIGKKEFTHAVSRKYMGVLDTCFDKY